MAIAPLRENFGLQPELGSDEMDGDIWEPFFSASPMANAGKRWPPVPPPAIMKLFLLLSKTDPRFRSSAYRPLCHGYVQ